MMGRETSGNTPKMIAPNIGPQRVPSSAKDNHAKNEDGLAEAKILGHDKS